jgi:hypothetical protein
MFVKNVRHIKLKDKEAVMRARKVLMDLSLAKDYIKDGELECAIEVALMMKIYMIN